MQQQRLLSAATECFRKYGFHNATIALISESSGMSVGRIYHYFANKKAMDEFERPRVDSDLMLEVHAEASRNPAIVKMISQIDRRLRKRIRKLIIRSDAERGRVDATDVDLRVEAL